MEKTKMLNTLVAISLVIIVSGCGSHVTGTNTALDVSHKDGPDCTQSGCHPGFGAGGTVFADLGSTIPASNVTVKAQSLSTGEIITFEESDGLGNFHYHEDLQGYYNMAIDGKPWSRPHSFPEWSGCNRCHRWPPTEGAKGKLN